MLKKLAMFAVLSLALYVMPVKAHGYNYNNDNGNHNNGNNGYLFNNNNGNDYTQNKNEKKDSKSVPEPGTLALLGVGLVGLVGVGYCRTRRAESL